MIGPEPSASTPMLPDVPSPDIDTTLHHKLVVELRAVAAPVTILLLLDLSKYLLVGVINFNNDPGLTNLKFVPVYEPVL